MIIITRHVHADMCGTLSTLIDYRTYAKHYD